jgi:hypothetical protein
VKKKGGSSPFEAYHRAVPELVRQDIKAKILQAKMDGYDALRNDGPMIENGFDEVYGASMGLHTRCQRLCVGMKAWKGR